MADEIDAELFRKLEQELHRPEVRSSRQAVSERVSEDFLEFGSSGRVYDKAVLLEALAQEALLDNTGPPEIHDFTVKVIAEDSVLVLYRSVRGSDGATQDEITLRSSIWKSVGGRWRMFFHQGTIVPHR